VRASQLCLTLASASRHVVGLSGVTVRLESLTYDGAGPMREKTQDWLQYGAIKQNSFQKGIAS
jgi:hypothetical protein